MRGAAAGALVAGCLACAVGPNYQRPETPTPASFRFAPPVLKPEESQSFADLPWWSVYQDPALKHLLGKALQENLDLRVAAWRVEEARARAHADLWALTPALAVNADAHRSKNQTAVPFPEARAPFSSFGVNAAAAWEIDAWGRLRRISEASRAQFWSAEENRRAVVSSLVADVAQNYFELRGLDLQRQIALRTIETRRTTLELYQSRLKAGIGAAPEVANGEALLAQAQAQEALVSLQIAQVEDRLSILLGCPPGEIARSVDATLEPPVPEIPAGIPSSLLERRPDIRAAEAQLISANAAIGVADANFFPQISLTAALGFLSPQLSNLLSGESESWRYGGTVGWLAPILAHHDLIDARDAAVARYEEAKAAYIRTVLVALQEVSDALVGMQQLQLQMAFLEKRVAALNEQRNFAVARFKAGVATYLEITTADESLFPAELALAQARTQRAQVIVSLYRALGGGWQMPEPEPTQKK